MKSCFYDKRFKKLDFFSVALSSSQLIKYDASDIIYSPSDGSEVVLCAGQCCDTLPSGQRLHEASFARTPIRN